MVVVSEATMIYNMRIVPSYISSNGYYGYVPPVYERVKHRSNYQQVQFNNQQKLHHDELQVHDQENIRTTHGHGISLGTSSHRHQYNEQHYDYNKPSAMETDGDEKTYFEETYRCQNNHCVISETTSRLVNGNGGVHLFDQTITNNNNNNVTISQRESRKRNSYDDPVFLPDYGIGQMKKSRQDGGNSQVIHGAGSTRKFGSTAVLNEPSSLCLVSNITSSLTYQSVVNDCVIHTAACNCISYSLMNDKYREDNREVPRYSIKSSNSLDYEKMLLQTHGCSIYHHERHQLQYSGVIESEF